MSHAETTIRPHLAYRGGSLEMDGVALAGLAERQPTPFFLVSERRLVDNCRALAAGLGAAGAGVTLRYCAKANHEAGILAILAREGTELVASHLAEVELALACGFPPARIAYQRPATPAPELEAVLALGVGMVHVFRTEDVELLARSAARLARPLRLSLRLRGPRSPLRSPLANLNARLGLDPAEARAAALACRASRWLEVAALNVYVGTQQRTANGFDAGLRRACELARRLTAEGVAEIDEINLGGGVPSPSLRKLDPRNLWARLRDRPIDRRREEGNERAIDAEAPARLERFARQLAERYRSAAARAGLKHPPTLGAEPGRSIVGNATVLVSRVTAAEGGWLFLDASRNFLGESPLLFRRTILPLGERPVGGERFVHLSGSTLNTTDVLDLRRRLPPLAPGDALAFCDAGAYSISRASRYAGVGPAVLLLDLAGRARLIRRPETAADLAGPMVPVLPVLPAAPSQPTPPVDFAIAPRG